MTTINFEIQRPYVLPTDKGYIMGFDVYFPDVGVTLNNVHILRPDTDLSSTWLFLQKNKGGYHVTSLEPRTRKAIGELATEIYNRERGTKLRFCLPSHEPDDAVLRRVMGAAA